MPYIRKAHVLFVGSGDICRALLATTLANSIGVAWMEARAGVLHGPTFAPKLRCELAGIDLPDQLLHRLDQANIEWTDLIVTLDEAADLACPLLPETVQKRCYPFPQPENSADLRRVHDAIRQRVEGMIAGMRMMNRCT